ncbi:MAG: aminotransferase class III-fold pyridoxal phosphate-dependent enzyme [Caldilineaceae bacterium SB0675_bin_29]|uniref:Aminotransferase class III-fold pyridoxal phosphate-dependent enzyme n=1 Tax=Caldilineaceae bacterium SB0675_bin_29 TaxID=2605266 RepID=A0A6B1G4T8_9CHLR|nr:aminotransferase class III-fold pyridoxal phosphate-dependent enzyme [Caldilineaceae bacterium SB0675_bin_29]
MTTFDGSRQLIAEASQHLPGGVNSNYRLGVAPTPLVFERGEGAYLYDADGNRMIDYYLGMGPMILGHNPAPVLEAVQEQLGSGILYAGQSRVEQEAARLVCEIVPCAERVRFSCAGSEVVQAVIRLARAATQRSVIIKFEGHYHGWMDNILWSIAPTAEEYGPEEAPNAIPASAGQDLQAGLHTEVLPWNNLEVLERRLEREDVAGVIMEPAMCNTSTVFPGDGYLEGVRRACTDTGTVLIFDEVITGFRVAPGGAQAHFGVTPDLATFGKAIASGFPVSCFAGRAELMELFASGGVMHGGTFNGHPACMAALVATLGELEKPETFSALDRQGTRLMEGIGEALEAADIQARVEGFPQIFHVGFGVEGEVTDYRSSLQADKERYVRFTEALHYRGVRALERGAWFLSTAHTADVVDETVAAVSAVAREI